MPRTPARLALAASATIATAGFAVTMLPGGSAGAAAVRPARAGRVHAVVATRTVRLDSHISIRDAGLTFRGRVTSANAACDFDRRVTLHRTNGNILGHVTTGVSGRWRITALGSAGISLGHFYATVARRSEGTAGTIYVCRGARSKTIPFHQ
jgi:FlaG/FlaF family flagellin (archaellin)